MGQATRTSSASWQRTIAGFAPRREPTEVTLSVSYRTPEEVLNFARATLRAADPDAEPPRPVRRAGVAPIVEHVERERLEEALAAACVREQAIVDPGRVAVLAVASRVPAIVSALRARGVDAEDPSPLASRGLAAPLVVIAAERANGLEFDSVIVIEPSEIIARGVAAGSSSDRGLRTLYVALTRPIRRLVVMHSEALPPSLGGV